MASPMSTSSARPLILASTSPYRRELLQRLGLDFEVAAPEVDETPRPGEGPADRARRLAEAKARAIARSRPEAVVIGSDQVAELDGAILRKPGNAERCHAQLTALSGRRALFHTACRIVGLDANVDIAPFDCTTVVVRTLTPAEIDRYIERERPFDCAGGFKVEALGITLFEAVESTDPTALIGLPLIAVASALRSAGYLTP